MTAVSPLQARSSSGFSWLGHSDLAGKPDGVQVMVNRQVAYVCHPFTGGGVTVVDVADPRKPTPLRVLKMHPRSWALHCQAYGQHLLVAEEFNFIAGKPATQWRDPDCDAGLRVYDISRPQEPKAVGFMSVQGLGLHRIWWDGGPYAYASALLDGYSDHMLICIDLKDPTHPREVGRFWMPGMWTAGGETPGASGRIALHHPVVADGIAYCGWRDAGLVLVDVRDPSRPVFLSQRNLRPPFGGNTHTALPLPTRALCIVADEASGDIADEGQRYIWVTDVREKANPVPIATMPIPAELDFVGQGGGFGPHNLWENRPDGFVSDSLVFATFQSGGVRAYDLTDPFHPVEKAHFVPPQPERVVDPRPGIKRITHSADVYVTAEGLAFVTDYNGGLYILQYE